MDPLESVRLKIDRAREHRQTFEREVIRFFSHEPERAIAQLDEQSQPPYRLVLTEPLPSHWPCLVGDFVQNLRQAFDHFVWAAASRPDLLRSKSHPPRQISFPITRDEGEWVKYLDTRTATLTKRAVGTDAWRVITEMQPHARWRPDPNPYTDPLWTLNELARIDRHQTLHPTIAQQHGTFVGFGPRPRIGNVIQWELGMLDAGAARFGTAEVQNDPRMGNVTFTDGDGVETEMAAYQHVSFEVVFDDPRGPFRDGWISSCLTALYESVKGYCLPRMEGIFDGSP